VWAAVRTPACVSACVRTPDCSLACACRCVRARPRAPVVSNVSLVGGRADTRGGAALLIHGANLGAHARHVRVTLDAGAVPGGELLFGGLVSVPQVAATLSAENCTIVLEHTLLVCARTFLLGVGWKVGASAVPAAAVASPVRGVVPA
jgi:hypothetical protein